MDRVDWKITLLKIIKILKNTPLDSISMSDEQIFLNKFNLLASFSRNFLNLVCNRRMSRFYF